jgi:hypothetical protein
MARGKEARKRDAGDPDATPDAEDRVSGSRASEPAPRQRHRPAAIVAAEPRSLTIAKRGVSTGADFAELMSALVSDIIEDRIDVNTANAVTNAGRQLLRVVELQYRYGSGPGGEEEGAVVPKPLKLLGG